MIINIMLIFLLVCIDQVSKILIEKSIQMGETIPIIEKFFHLTYVKNKGVAFGFFYDNVSIFVAIGVIAVAGIILYMHKKREEHSNWSRFGFLFILGGAIGNLADRGFRGYVVDFIDFRGVWPYIFNIADVAINIGVILIIIEYFIENEKVKKEEKSQ